ncbi:MAG: hypothetical protein K6V73_00025 [Firmicutes bacterium]|nr:hypothetical protein [Bacillota bacterium]
MSPTRPGPELWAWPIFPLGGGGGAQRGPSAWELTLGPIGDHGHPRLRPSPPAGEGAVHQVRSCLKASASLGPVVVLPWAVRSADDAERLLELLAACERRPRTEVAVPVAPAGFVAESAQRVAEAGYRLAAAGEPYLHRSAIDRLSLRAGDMVLLAPVPDRAPAPWLRDLAALGRGRAATVARAVSSRRLAGALAEAGVTHANGGVLGPPLRAPLLPASRPGHGDGPYP